MTRSGACQFAAAALCSSPTFEEILMRAEIASLSEEIADKVSLLRRRL
ncbi:hypothetical protein U91I_03250 [alpha proteobacterium U9-1i]|nr:hypothetical protein U91I_03250 [alpha proteobacterium U9-1i]